MAYTKYNVTQPKTDQIYASVKPNKKGRYESSSKDSKLQDLISKVNSDQIGVQKAVKKMISALQQTERLDDKEIYSLVQDTIKNIITDIFDTTTPTDEQKKKVLKKIVKLIDSKISVPKNIQNTILKNLNEYIKNEITSIVTDIKENLRQETENAILNSTDTKKLYKKILTNDYVVKSINNHYKGILFENFKKKDKQHIQNIINQFKSKNSNIFKFTKRYGAKKMYTTEYFSKGIISKTYKNYNTRVIGVFTHIVKKLKAKSWQEIQTNMTSSFLKQKFNRMFHRKSKMEKELEKLTETKTWEKKFERHIPKSLRTGKDKKESSFLGNTVIGVANVMNLIVKTAFKLGLKVAKTALNILSKSLSIAKNIFMGSLSLIKNLVSLSLKFIKATVITAKNIFQKVLLFCMTPTGAYITGLICGFLYERIKELFGFLFEKSKEYYDKLKKKLIELDARWSEDDIIINEDGTIEVKPSLYASTKEKLLNITSKISEYIDLFRDDNSENWDQFKTKLNEDTEYAEKILDIEALFVKFCGGSTNGLDRKFEGFKDFFSKILNSDFIKGMETYIDCINTPAPTRAIAGKAIKGTVSTLVPLACIGIGAALGGPVGAILGGAVGGVLSSIYKASVEYAFSKKPYTGNDAVEVLKVLKQIDKESSHTKNTEGLQTMKFESERLQTEINLLKNRQKSGKITEKEKQRLSEKEKQKQELDAKIKPLELINEAERNQNIMFSNIEKIPPSVFLLAPVDEIVKYISEIDQNKLKQFDSKYIVDGKSFRSEYINKVFNIGVDTMKNYAKQMAMNYASGETTYEGFVYEYNNIREQLFKKESGIYDNNRASKKYVRRFTFGELIEMEGLLEEEGKYYRHKRKTDDEMKYINIAANKQAKSRGGKTALEDSLNLAYDSSHFTKNLEDRYLKIQLSKNNGERRYDHRQISLMNKYKNSFLTVIGRTLVDGANNKLTNEEIYKNVYQNVDNLLKYYEEKEKQENLKLQKEIKEEAAKPTETSVEKSYIPALKKFNDWILPQSVDTSKVVEIFQDGMIKDKKTQKEYNSAVNNLNKSQKKYKKEVDRMDKISKVDKTLYKLLQEESPDEALNASETAENK